LIYSSFKTCVSICMMTQILITYHLNNLIWKNIKYKLEIIFLNSSNNNKNWGWPDMVYLIWKIHNIFCNIDKRLLKFKIQNLIFNFFYFLTKVITNWHILTCFWPLGLMFILYKEKAIGLLCIMNCKILGANSFFVM
jgi:hypothetical protein